MTDLGRVLVADDDETFLYSTADLLRREGYQCDCAPDSATAAEMLEKEEYDLLIADIKMPGNPQLELIQDLPRLAEGMPVILATGYPSLDSAIQSIQLPVVAYLVKPIEFDQLLSQVQTSIENFQVYRATLSARQRLQDWLKELRNIEEVLKDTSRLTSSASVDAFVELTFQNIVGSLSDLRHLTKAVATDNVEVQEACHLLNCPRLTMLTDALVETIDVLEQTKGAFKSKMLGALRRKLEGIVRTERNEASPTKGKSVGTV